MKTWILNALKRFWWILSLVGIAVFLWVRSLMRQAKRTAIVQKQLDVERDMRNTIQKSDTISRTEMQTYQQHVEASRVETQVQKKQLDDAMAADSSALSDAWNRAFSKSRGTPTAP